MVNEVRERSREILKSELAEAAMTYVAEVGYDRVSAEQIAREIGVSRATFLRYFRTKEDAIIAAVRVVPESTADLVRSIEAGERESVWAALRRALAPFAHAVDERAEELRRRRALITATPALRARVAALNIEQFDELVAVIREKVENDEAASVLALSMGAALEAAWRSWAHDNECTFSEALDRSFALLAALDELR